MSDACYPETEPVTKTYADALVVGEKIALGNYTASAEEIIAFASRWDPQDFHVDPVAAAAGQFGGIIGSGIHSLAIFQRLAVLGAYGHWAVLAGRRVRSIDLSHPLRPAVTLSADVTIESIEHIRPDRSLVVTRGRLLLDDDTVMLECVLEAYVRRNASD